jgi:hypothetical protein
LTFLFSTTALGSNSPLDQNFFGIIARGREAAAALALIGREPRPDLEGLKEGERTRRARGKEAAEERVAERVRARHRREKRDGKEEEEKEEEGIATAESEKKKGGRRRRRDSRRGTRPKGKTKEPREVLTRGPLQD